jgi:hypothetical protein
MNNGIGKEHPYQQIKGEAAAAPRISDTEAMLAELENLCCKVDSCSWVASLLSHEAENWFQVGRDSQELHRLGGLGLIDILSTRLRDINDMLWDFHCRESEASAEG